MKRSLFLALGQRFQQVPSALLALVGLQHGGEVAERDGTTAENAHWRVKVVRRAVRITQNSGGFGVGADKANGIEGFDEQEHRLRIEGDVRIVR